LTVSVLLVPTASAFAGQFPDQSTSGSIGLEGKISTAAPSTPATITTPSNGATFTSLPIKVNGLCTSGLLVKLFSNNVFVGSTVCVNGSYSIQVDLFNGLNDLVARIFDNLDQPGPDSNLVSVIFNDTQVIQFGTHVLLTSNNAERGAPPGTEIVWPIILTGGNGPYAMSVDWGDGGPTDLFTQANVGTVTIKHTYTSAGIYRVIVKATDKNGGEAFLQVVAVASGSSQSNTKASSGSGSNNITTKVEFIWWPAVAMIPLIFAAFFVGRREELFALRRQLEKTRAKEKL
jgi:hypothetical protein